MRAGARAEPVAPGYTPRRNPDRHRRRFGDGRRASLLVTRPSNMSTSIDDSTLTEICDKARASSQTVLRRLVGLPVRGAVARVVDAELQARGLAPARRSDSNPPPQAA